MRYVREMESNLDTDTKKTKKEDKEEGEYSSVREYSASRANPAPVLLPENALRL